jgi:hypothetical protein
MNCAAAVPGWRRGCSNSEHIHHEDYEALQAHEDRLIVQSKLRGLGALRELRDVCDGAASTDRRPTCSAAHHDL